jgi:pimeloyl-ACP methyl ester carboxylesterase
MLPAIEHLSPNFTCFAFDIPGLGLSHALPIWELKLSDLANAIAKCMRLISMPPCPIYGRHTGAAIALELAVGHPALVTGVVLDGLSAFTEAECASIFKGYFPPMPVDELGGHFAQTWTRFRDHLIWFPWFRRLPENLNGYDLAPAVRVQNLAMMYFHGAKSYQPVYRAALSHGRRALVAVSQLTKPATFMALETDMLYSHLARLPKLRKTQVIRPIGQSIDRKHELIAESFSHFGATATAPVTNGVIGTTATVECQFIDVVWGKTTAQLHVRYAGNCLSPPLVLLHDAPGSALFLEPLILILSSHYFVCAPDLPGCGESASLPGETHEMLDFAEVVVDLCTKIGMTRPVLYGIGFGSSVAIALATTWPANFSGLVLRGVLLPDSEQNSHMRQHFAPEIKLENDGSHWYRTWQMLRDSQIYWPWYDQRHQSQRRVSCDFSAERLHDWTFDLMKQPAGYRHIIHGALNYDASAELARIEVPLLICIDSSTPLSAFDTTLLERLPDVARLEASNDIEHVQSICRYFLCAN